MNNDNMLEIKQQVDQALLVIDELLKKDLVDTAYHKYSELIKKIESEEYEIDAHLKAKVYASFAYFLFGVSEYEYFFRMLIKAQDYGYSKDEIKKILWEAFIQPNLDEFQTIYEANLKFLISNEYIEKPVGFEELPFWLVPTGAANEYYMYDKEQKLITDKISLYNYQTQALPPASDAFADYLLLEGSSCNSVLSYTNAISKLHKKTYIVLNDIVKFLSCLQGGLLNDGILSNVVIFDSLYSMSEYFKSSNAFLPRNIIDLIEQSEPAQAVLNEVHSYRIRKENRKGDHVLLSICIPSFNRGNRAYDNVNHLIQSYYDEEIEIIVSNNGTQNETKEHYDQLREIDDARLNYFAFEENQGFAINCCKICELASGEFILLLSDEDLLDFNVLDTIINILNKSKETLAIMRTSTASQSKPTNITAKPGKDALLTFMLTSNYMSGIIFNNKLIKQHKGIEYIKENLGNNVCFMYPHMVWELLLSQYGNVQGTDLILINEGKAEKTEVDEIEIDGGDIIPYYATIEGRLEQHEGFANVFKDLEKCKQDADLFREMYIKLCIKTLHLATLSINVYYRKTGVNVRALLDRAYDFCSNQEFYKTNINSVRNHYRNDLKIINQYYEHFKNQM